MKDNEINKTIGSQLKLARKAKEWSLDKTCQHTGVSKAMLGQIERGESSPTIAKLWDIANGFEYPLSYFLDNGVQRSIQTQPAHEPLNEGIIIKTLFPFNTETNLEIFSLTLSPMHEHISLPHNKGVIEHILVISGEMEYYLEGKWHRLKKGENLKFNASQKHGYRNTSNNSVIFHNIISYTK